jgi:hypothetical protein
MKLCYGRRPHCLRAENHATVVVDSAALQLAIMLDVTRTIGERSAR